MENISHQFHNRNLIIFTSNKEGKVFLRYADNRLIVNYSNVEIYSTILKGKETKQIYFSLISLLSFSNELTDYALYNSRIVETLLKNNSTIKFMSINVSYEVSNNRVMKYYRERDSINREAYMFLVSEYFIAFKCSKFASAKKKRYIEIISVANKLYTDDLEKVLLSIEKDFTTGIKSAGQIELIEFLKAYAMSKNIYGI